MHARFIRGFALLALSLGIAACAAGAKPSGTMPISNQVWGHYQKYLNDIGHTNPGAFAVSRDGYSAFYFYCQEARCQSGGTYKNEAVKRCRSTSGRDCYVFAFGREIQVAYKVME